MKIEMVYLKSTKNTHVFQAKEEGSPVPTLYVRKASNKQSVGLPSDAPTKLTLEVTVNG